MKKLPILGIAAMLLSLVSCKKAYTCECTTTYDNDVVVSTRDISKTSKKTAEAICGNYSEKDTYTSISPAQTNTETYNTICALK